MVSSALRRERAKESGPFLLFWLIPLLVTAVWVGWALLQVDRHEAGMASRSGVAYAVFVQIGHCWNQGWGWLQTVHPNYVERWHWGGHFGVLWLGAARLSSLFDSPWALARIQVTWVGLGCFSAWLLGWAEGRIPGGLVGLLLYAGSGSIVYIAMDDYQDLTLCLPLIPLVVWAARHAPAWVFVLAAAALASVREELWFLLPLAGLSRNCGRALLGALVAVAWYWLLHETTVILWEPPPLFRIEAFMGAEHAVIDPRRLDLAASMFAFGSATPFFLLQPGCALAALGTSLFHAQPALDQLTGGLRFSHQLAPIAGFAVAGAVVVLARVARFGVPGAVVALLLAGGSVGFRLDRDWEVLRRQVVRSDGSRHPAWELLEQVPSEAVLFVPSHLCPAAAHRRWLANEQSMPQRIRPETVTHAVVPADCGIQGTRLARSGPWVLLADPSGLPSSGDPVRWNLSGARFDGCYEP